MAPVARLAPLLIRRPGLGAKYNQRLEHSVARACSTAVLDTTLGSRRRQWRTEWTPDHHLGRARRQLAFREDPGGAGREVGLTALADAPGARVLQPGEKRSRRRGWQVLWVFAVKAGSWPGHAPRDDRVRQAQSGLGAI
jgi:hypothetical protein